MLTPTVTNVPDATQVSQADNIRNTMSLSNLLSAPASIKSENTDNTPASASPFTPTKVASLLENGVDSPDTVMSEISELEESNESVEIDKVVDEANREFTCVNDEFTPCQTGQYTKDLSRKVISDHFGRNKACTRDITYWPLFCRKHYQRATYNKELWQLRKIKLILRQIDIIEEQFPGTTYDVHFKKSEEVRLNQYSRQVAAGMTNEESAKTFAPNAGKHFEASIDVLRELDQYLGSKKSVQDVKEIVDVISQMLEAKDTEQIPSIEFLPQVPSKSASPKKTPIKAPAMKSPQTSKSPKSSDRISVKGSVKKTTYKA